MPEYLLCSSHAPAVHHCRTGLALFGFVTRPHPTNKHKRSAWAQGALQTPPLTALWNRGRYLPGPGSCSLWRGLPARHGQNLQKRYPPKQPDSGITPYTESEAVRGDIPAFRRVKPKSLRLFRFSLLQQGCGKGFRGPQPYATGAGASRASREGFSRYAQMLLKHMKTQSISCARQSVPGQM